MSTESNTAEAKKDLMKIVNDSQINKTIPTFRTGDIIKVHTKIVEGNKERIQIFEGIVLKRHRRNSATATFTVRKVSYGIGVERTFPLHSPRVAKIEMVTPGKIRRARLFYLRPLRGKASKVKARYMFGDKETSNQNVTGEVA